MYWDNSKLEVKPYHQNKKIYYCGKELLKFDSNESIIYTIMVVDLQECILCDIMSTGEIKKLININSEVPGQHKSGGQSAQRFARIRDQEIIKWYKRVNEYLKPIQGREIKLAINFVYKSKFMKYLSTYNKNKFKEFTKYEYGGMNGVWQYINKIEYEKKIKKLSN